MQSAGALNMPNKIQLAEYSTSSDIEGILYKTATRTATSTCATSTGTTAAGTGTTTGSTTTSTTTTLLRSPQLSLSLPDYLFGEFCFISCPFQPPSILPISSIFVDKAIYFLSVKDLVSQSINKNTFSVSIFCIALFT